MGATHSSYQVIHNKSLLTHGDLCIFVKSAAALKCRKWPILVLEFGSHTIHTIGVEGGLQVFTLYHPLMKICLPIFMNGHCTPRLAAGLKQISVFCCQAEDYQRASYRWHLSWLCSHPQRCKMPFLECAMLHRLAQV